MTEHVEPTPGAGQPNPQQAYYDLLQRYNQLYGSIRALLVASHRVESNVVLTEDELLAEVGTIFRDAGMAPQVLMETREEDKADRRRWQRDENRWRALDMTAKQLSPGQNVESWIDMARKLSEAIESEGFTA